MDCVLGRALALSNGDTVVPLYLKNNNIIVVRLPYREVLTLVSIVASWIEVYKALWKIKRLRRVNILKGVMFFFKSMSVRVSLRTPRLISRKNQLTQQHLSVKETCKKLITK